MDGSARRRIQPPPPAPQTFAADAPAARPTRDEHVDLRSGDPRSQLFPQGPLGSQLPADLRPILTFERLPHHDGDVTNLSEEIDDLLVAIEMALRDLPVIDPRVAGFSRVSQDDSLFELTRVERQRLMPYAGWSQLHADETPVHRGSVVLRAGGNPQHLCLEVEGEGDQLFRRVRPLLPLRQGAAQRDVEGGRAGQARPDG